MTHEWFLWIVAVAIAVHLMEEYMLDWVPWGKRYLNYNGDWSQYLVLAAALQVAGFAAAGVGWRWPGFSLGIVTESIIDAILLHIAPSIIWRRVSPGIFTATLVYLPVGATAFYFAALDSVLTWHVVLQAIAVGFVVHLLPFLFNLMGPYFRRQSYP